ncbi:MAG TPA: recombination protein RecR [Spirochaetes bacterium]|nr:recombination protein RecR [Spirochaetota bacterium]
MNQKGSISRLIHEFSKLPGIGRKTAERLVFFILKEDALIAKNLAEALFEVKKNVKFCRICFSFTESDLCEICANSRRNGKVICIVEEPKDIWAVEKSGTYNGVYHVLMGVISPLDGVGPDDLRIKELIKRIENNEVDEIILATDPNIEGDVTALYISKLIKPLGVSVTRIASGLPVGGDLEYADAVTLSKALSGRTPI